MPIGICFWAGPGERSRTPPRQGRTASAVVPVSSGSSGHNHSSLFDGFSLSIYHTTSPPIKWLHRLIFFSLGYDAVLCLSLFLHSQPFKVNK